MICVIMLLVSCIEESDGNVEENEVQSSENEEKSDFEDVEDYAYNSDVEEV